MQFSGFYVRWKCAGNFNNLPLYILLLDWEKAYDTINWEGLISAMKRLGTPDKYIREIRILYTNPHFFVSDRLGSSSTRSMFRWLWQGDGLSCLLFICVLSVIFYDAEQAWRQAGARITDRDRVIQAFGREVANYTEISNLFSCDPEAPQIVLHELQWETRRYGLELSIDKTWLILVGAARDNPTLMDLDGRPLRVTDSHRTLGFSVGQTSRVSAQVRQRGGTTLSTMNQ